MALLLAARRATTEASLEVPWDIMRGEVHEQGHGTMCQTLFQRNDDIHTWIMNNQSELQAALSN
jgi:hypothetical protein